MSHIYVKGYLVPDKSKDSKRKTCLRKLGRSEERRTSRDSITLWDNEEAESDKTTGKRMGQRLVSSLKRGSRSSLHREKSRDQSKNLVFFSLLFPGKICGSTKTIFSFLYLVFFCNAEEIHGTS